MEEFRSGKGAWEEVRIWSKRLMYAEEAGLTAASESARKNHLQRLRAAERLLTFWHQEGRVRLRRVLDARYQLSEEEIVLFRSNNSSVPRTVGCEPCQNVNRSISPPVERPFAERSYALELFQARLDTARLGYRT